MVVDQAEVGFVLQVVFWAVEELGCFWVSAASVVAERPRPSKRKRLKRKKSQWLVLKG